MSVTALASVVIPTRNRGELVERSVDSALRAESVGEVIVVDDGSTDDTLVRLERFGPGIRVLSGVFGSAAAARNVGASWASFPLLAFLDSDDEMLRTKVPCLAAAFEDSAVGLVHGWIEVIQKDGRRDDERTASHEELFQRAERLGTGYAALARHCAMFTSATLMRKDAFEEVGGYDESLPPPYEDLDLYLRLSLTCRLVYVRRPVARYRIWSGNFDSRAHAEGMLVVSHKHLRFLNALSTVGMRSKSTCGLETEALRRKARFGLYRRIAVSSQTLLKTGDTRRFLLRAACNDPGAIDLGMVRLFVVSFAPKGVLRRRRHVLAT